VDTPAGVLFYQNTLVGQVRYFGPAANVHFRNNLILSDGWSPEVFALRTTTNYSSSDYNGFRINPGAPYDFEWDSPPFAVRADYQGSPVVRRFSSLAQYQQASGQDRHSRLLDFDVLEKAQLPDKNDPQHLYSPEDFDFRLRAGSAAVDAGTTLPGITDAYTGQAPDLGAYERGVPPPEYGPRRWPTGQPGAQAPRSLRGPPAQRVSG